MIDKDKVIQLAKEAGVEFEADSYREKAPNDYTVARTLFEDFERFAQAIYRQGLEDAAKVCEEQANGLTLVPLEAYRAFFLADSIRSLKESTNG